MRGMLLGAALVAVLIVSSTAAAAPGRPYSAEIRRTAGGMPHIKARDYGSLGFGYAYAYAEDQACRFADIVATVRAQRSRYFGANAGYGDLGGTTNNLTSDFFYQRIKDSRIVERHGPAPVPARPRQGRAPDRARLRRRLERVPAPHGRRQAARPALPRREVGHADQADRPLPALLPARAARLEQGADGGDGRCRAARREGRGGPRPTAGRHRRAGLERGGGRRRRRARRARALLLSNTHFPSGTDVRWYELHLTIPGKLDAIGAALQGVPVVNVGFNRHIAWTHTVSTARRFAAYELKLAPGRPDGVPRRRQDGADAQAHRPRRRSHAHVLRDDLGPRRRAAGRDADLDVGHRVRAGRCQRGQPPPHEPVGGVEPGDLGRRLAARGRADPGQSVGQLDRRGRPRQRLLRRRRRDAEPAAGVPGALRHGEEPAAAWAPPASGCSTARAPAARCPPTATPPRRGSSAAAVAPAHRAARLRVQLQRLVLAAERQAAADRASRA